MTQADLNRAVARRTGESTTLIRQMGFILLPQPRRRWSKVARSARRPPAAASRRPDVCSA